MQTAGALLCFEPPKGNTDLLSPQTPQKASKWHIGQHFMHSRADAELCPGHHKTYPTDEASSAGATEWPSAPFKAL